MPASRRPPRASGSRSSGGSDLMMRILVAVPAAIAVVVFIDLGGLVWALFMIAVGWACLHELFRLLERWRPVAIVGFASVAGLVLAARFGTIKDVMEVLVATLPVLFVFAIVRGQGHATVSIAGTLLGIFWIGLAATHGVLLRQLPHGGGVVIDVLLGTFIGDTGAYIGGRLFGRRALAPAISPNKTVEGLFCGALAAILAVFVAGNFETWMTQGNALLLGLAVAIFGPLGDLFESAIKRDAGAKDAGSFFGPHGGVLDRADAALFTIVAGYYVWFVAIH